MRTYLVVTLLFFASLANAQNFKKMARAEKWSEIIEEGNAEIADGKADANTHFFVGKAYLAKDNLNEAMAALEKCVELNSAFAPAHKLLALQYSARSGTVSKGIQHYEKALEGGKCSYAYRYQIISSLSSAGACDKSLELAQHFENDTVYPPLYRTMAVCFKNSKAPEKALLYLNRYIPKIDTSIVEEKDAILYAEIYDDLNDVKRSIAWYIPVHARNLTDEKTAVKLAELYGKDKDYANMAETLERHIEASGSEKTSLKFLLASAYFNLEDYEKADGIYTQVCEKYPDMVVGYLKRAQCASKLDTDSEGLAKPHYEKVLAIVETADGKHNPRYKSAYQSANAFLGSYYLNTEKDLEKSKAHWNNVLEVNEYNSMARRALEHINELQGD